MFQFNDQQKVRLKYLLVSGFFLYADQLLKYLARSFSDFSYYFFKPWLGWEYFENAGVAFGIPVPSIVSILLSVVIIVAVLFWAITRPQKENLMILGFYLIVGGAISNLYDRIAFSFTTDYIRLGQSVVNIADLMIVGGFVLIWFIKRRQLKS